MDTAWIKQHKWVVAIFGAAAGGFILYSYLNRSSSASGTASSIVGGLGTSANAFTSAGSPQYLVPVVQDATAPSPTPSPTLTTPVSNVPVPSTPTLAPTNPTSITQPVTTTAAVIAANPYTVGTKVTSAETITQAVYDPLYNGYVDLTSKGGIYGGNLNVSGSAYNPAWSGSGRLALVNGGADVQEYGANGALLGTYKVGK